MVGAQTESGSGDKLKLQMQMQMHAGRQAIEMSFL